MIALSRLPHSADKLIGRETELTRLQEAWEDPAQHVLVIRGIGGEGKTSLVAEWTSQLAKRKYDNAWYFDWSFYSQGTRDQTTASSDSFIAAALGFFGSDEGKNLANSPASGRDKAIKLLEYIRRERTLLVLDGLEPLQYPPGPLAGQLRDDAMSVLLKGLAQSNPGLCIVTTREPVTDLARFQETTAPGLELVQLSDAAGAALLQRLLKPPKPQGIHQVESTLQEREEISRAVKGHALTVRILGTFIHRALRDVRRWQEVDYTEADKQYITNPKDTNARYGHAFKTIEAYERWLKSGGLQGASQLAVLRLLGLFDRPASRTLLAALRAEPIIPGLTEAIVGIAESDWNITLSELEECGLVSLPRSDSVNATSRISSVDAHPLLREYFARQLCEQHHEAWRAAHRRLYEHLCATTKESDKPTLEELQPLYQAVFHGCQAGMQKETYENVYFARINRSKEYYSWKQLGSFGSDLGAVACFFETPWSSLSPFLTEADQAELLSEAAMHLRALGRLTEALEPMLATLVMGISQENFKEAAIRASNLSELKLTLGEVAGAVMIAEKSMSYAKRSGVWAEMRDELTTFADALHQSGKRAEAQVRFGEAEVLQAVHEPDCPLLYSVRGFRYCDLLLVTHERAAWELVCSLGPRVLKETVAGEETLKSIYLRAARGLKLAEHRNDLISIGLDYLTLGRTALYEAILKGSSLDTCCPAIQNAMDGLRRAGYQEELPDGLLTRAWFRALTGHHIGPESAQADLDEAWDIAERGPMQLHMADIHLHRARLFFREEHYPWDSPQKDLAEARQLIEKCGYGRRKEELEDAEAFMKTLPKAHPFPAKSEPVPGDLIPTIPPKPQIKPIIPEVPMAQPDRPANNEFDSVIELIAADKLEEALTELKAKTRSAPRSLSDRIVMQSGRLTRNTQASKEGRLARDDAEVERTRIAEALLGLIRELEQTSPPPARELAVTNAEVLVAMRQLEAARAKGAVDASKQFEVVHGANNLKSISWIELGVRASRSVCRILIPSPTGTGYGTGFLMGQGRVMTNNHVIGSISEAKLAKIEFNYQLSPDASAEPTVRYDLDPDTFFHTDPANKLDYTVVAVRDDANKPPLEKWGTLLLNAHAEPLQRELVAVIQHPNGQVKQIVMTANTVVQAKAPFLHYTCDTMPGSSGSPVFNDLWQVVAIHHKAGPTIDGEATNEGIMMSAIRPNLGTNWPVKAS